MWLLGLVTRTIDYLKYHWSKLVRIIDVLLYLIFKVILFSQKERKKEKEKNRIYENIWDTKYFTNVTIMFHSTLLKHISFSLYSETKHCGADKISHYSTHMYTKPHLKTFILPTSVSFQYQTYIQ